MMILICVLWYLSGCLLFAYWLTNKHSLYTSDIPFMLFFGLLGPTMLLFGWMVFGGGKNDTVIFKRRNP
jgi:hypothetical protein